MLVSMAVKKGVLELVNALILDRVSGSWARATRNVDIQGSEEWREWRGRFLITLDRTSGSWATATRNVGI